MKKLIFIPLFIFFTFHCFSQSFIAAVDNIPMNTETIVTTIDGVEITGKIRSAGFVNGIIKSIRLKDADETIHKFKAADIKTIKVKATFLSKLDMITDKTSSLKEIRNTNFDEIIDREWIYFHQIISPKKHKKPLLLQLQNPGFDSKMKVYNNPSAQETSTFSLGDTNIGGGEDRSYIAVMSDGTSFYIRKAKYDKTLKEYLGNCDEFMEVYKDKKLKFKNIAMHVYYYNTYCN